MSPSLCLGGPVASPGLGSNERGFSKGEHSSVATFHKLFSFIQTWMTYSWSLSWANVDKAFLVEQETKAGFWNQDIQVFLIKEYIQGLCMSLGDLRQPLSGQSKSNTES